MSQRFFSQSLKPEDATQITEEFRTIYQWIDSNPNVIYSTLQTTDATVTDSIALSLNEGAVVYIDVVVLAAETDETNRALYHLEGLFYRATSGNVTQQGSTVSITSIESDADWNCTLNADTTAQAVDVRVTGKASTTINWKVIVKYKKVS